MSSTWKLINVETGAEIHIGDIVTTFRGEKVKLIGLQPPHKPEASGKVVCEDDNFRDNVWYCGVVGCRFERIGSEPTIVDGKWIIDN